MAADGLMTQGVKASAATVLFFFSPEHFGLCNGWVKNHCLKLNRRKDTIKNSESWVSVWAPTQYKDGLSGMAIPMFKIWRSGMGILMLKIRRSLVRRHLYTETGPSLQFCTCRDGSAATEWAISWSYPYFYARWICISKRFGSRAH